MRGWLPAGREFRADIAARRAVFSGLDADSKRISADAILRVFPDAAMLIVTHVPEDAALLGSTRGIDADFPGFSGVSD